MDETVVWPTKAPEERIGTIKDALRAMEEVLRSMDARQIMAMLLESDKAIDKWVGNRAPGRRSRTRSPIQSRSKRAKPKALSGKSRIY